MKNVFVKNGELVIGGNGRLCSLEDLEHDVCIGNKPIEGLIQIESGVVSWYNSNEMESKEENRENGEIMEYIEHKEIKTLYTELIDDIDELLEEVLNVCSDEDDVLLKAVVRGKHNNTIKLYNYCRMNGKIIKEDTNCHISMLAGLFVA
jgi:hypothetical protein